ncbi:MAG TPA: M48 family metalloprotease [Acidimicrobiales bacterium]|nr:M48 family metalloprotease [Acidimicrobiales bacterium]
MSSTSLSRPEVPGRAEIAANRRRAGGLALLPAFVVFVVVAVIVGALVSVVVGIIVGVVAGLLVALGVWRSGPAVVFRLTGARVAGFDEQPRVHNLIDGLCAASGVPKPTLRVVDDDTPNAMTVGLHPRRATIVITTGLVSALGRIELEAVLAHEVSHVKVHDILPGTVAVTALGPVAALFPPAGGLPSRGAGRTREALADLAGVALTRYPPGLISALEKVGSDSRAAGQRRRARDRAVDHLWIFGQTRALDERLLALREL